MGESLKDRWSFTKIINAVDLHLEQKFQPGAYKWIDDNYDNAWTKALTRFDDALTRYAEAYKNFKPGMEEIMWDEAMNYMKVTTHYFDLYKKHLGQDEKKAFIESLRRKEDGDRDQAAKASERPDEIKHPDLRGSQVRKDDVCVSDERRQGSFTFSN